MADNPKATERQLEDPRDVCICGMRRVQVARFKRELDASKEEVDRLRKALSRVTSEAFYFDGVATWHVPDEEMKKARKTLATPEDG